MQTDGAVQEGRRSSSSHRLCAGDQGCGRKHWLLYFAAVPIYPSARRAWCPTSAAFRFSGELPGPYGSITSQLTRPDAELGALNVRYRLPTSVAVVSNALAAGPMCPTGRRQGRQARPRWPGHYPRRTPRRQSPRHRVITPIVLPFKDPDPPRYLSSNALQD
jgi:hypothetical protein